MPKNQNPNKIKIEIKREAPIDAHIKEVLGRDIVVNTSPMPGANKIRCLLSKNILNTPGPYSREWLNANGLQIVYKHGKAVLQSKK